MRQFEFKTVRMTSRQTWADGRDDRCCPNEYIGCGRD